MFKKAWVTQTNQDVLNLNNILEIIFTIIKGEIMESITISKTEYEELLKYKYILTLVEDELHERQFKEEFVKKTEEIRKEMDKGKKVRFQSVEEMDEYLRKTK